MVEEVFVLCRDDEVLGIYAKQPHAHGALDKRAELVRAEALNVTYDEDGQGFTVHHPDPTFPWAPSKYAYKRYAVVE